jgi:quinol-cytochrome oxidoreductase complex cytochrome b subunit/cytochrome c2
MQKDPVSSTPSPAGERFVSFGTVLLLLAMVAVVTGLALWPFYSPTWDAAHRSVQAMERSFPLRLLRGVHHWGSALLLLLGAAYLVYGLFTGAYRRPWHLAWIASIGLVLLFFLFQLTGHLLPWDSQGVSTAVIETGIAANVPVIGRVQAQLLRGGEEAVSPPTLAAWFHAHVTLLPAVLAGLAALFLAQGRRNGARLKIPAVPTVAVLVLLLLASATLRVPHGPEATPNDYNSYDAPPEWYTAPLHALLALAQRIRPSLAFLGTVVVPGLVVLLLLALPWLDKKRADEPPSGAVRGLALLGVIGGLGLTLMGARHLAPLVGTEGGANGPAAAPQNPTPAANTPPAALDPALVQRGESLYAANGCQGCHKIAGQGESVGPPLDGVGQRWPDLDWQIRHLKNPSSEVPGSTMPAFNQLSDDDLKALASYLVSLR